jgi:hypothetical protein
VEFALRLSGTERVEKEQEPNTESTRKRIWIFFWEPFGKYPHFADTIEIGSRSCTKSAPSYKNRIGERQAVENIHVSIMFPSQLD